MNDLEALITQAEDLAGKATPGPWVLDDRGEVYSTSIRSEPNSLHGIIIGADDHWSGEQTLRFIAWCRTGVPQLVAAIKELQAKHDGLLSALVERLQSEECSKEATTALADICSGGECIDAVVCGVGPNHIAFHRRYVDAALKAAGEYLLTDDGEVGRYMAAIGRQLLAEIDRLKESAPNEATGALIAELREAALYKAYTPSQTHERELFKRAADALAAVNRKQG